MKKTRISQAKISVTSGTPAVKNRTVRDQWCGGSENAMKLAREKSAAKRKSSGQRSPSVGVSCRTVQNATGQVRKIRLPMRLGRRAALSVRKKVRQKIV